MFNFKRLKMESNLFSSKIILFGEYTILQGSKALAIPYSKFSGQLQVPDNMLYTIDIFQHNSNNILTSLYKYIHQTINQSPLINLFDIELFKADLAKGIYFQSNIPNGYGIGSSGALIAAIYFRYVKKNERDTNENLTNIQQQLAYLESYFHKKSSGIDPLVSYLNKPILLHNNKIEILNSFTLKDDCIHPFLLDSQQERTNKNLISHFLEECDIKNYLSYIRNDLIICTNNCIESLMDNNNEQFFQHLQQLSKFQFTYFKAAIPNSLINTWKSGLNTNTYYLKLCGAGGGGFLLGFSKENITKLLPFTPSLITKLKNE